MTVDGPDAAQDDYQAALTDLLYAVADDELVIGHRNAEWTGLGPIIEEDIAFSSMAQDELGHAQAHYSLLAGLGEGEPDDLAFARDAASFRNATLVELPRGDYAFSLMRQYLYDAAESVRLEALKESSYKPLADTAVKVAQEEKYHLIHGEAFVRRLGGATAESHERMQAGLDEAFPYALGLFEETEWESTLVEAGISPPQSELLGQWLDEVVPFLREAGLTVPATRDEDGRWQPTVEAKAGGRRGQHTEHLSEILDAMQMVYRSDPEAIW